MLLSQFLKDIHIEGTVCQIGTGGTTYAYGEQFFDQDPTAFLDEHHNKNIYFLANIERSQFVSPPHSRNVKDEHVMQKRYVYFDYDIRKVYEAMGQSISEEAIKEFGDMFIQNVSQHPRYSKWSYIVFSGNGLHVYYIGEPVRINHEFYSRGYALCAKELDEIFGMGFEADPSCKNPARIGRLPYTYNNKNYKHIPVEIIHHQNAQSDMIEHFMEIGAQKETIEEKPVVFTAPKIKDVVSAQEVLHYAKTTSIKSLCDAFSISYTKDNSIIINGEVTSAKINEAGNYINRFSGKEGSGDFVGLLKTIYNIDFKEALNMIAERLLFRTIEWTDKDKNTLSRLEELLQKAQVKTNIEERFLTPVVKNKKTWGIASVDKSMYGLGDGEYILLLGEPGTGKTTAALWMAIQNARKGVKTLFVSLEMTKERIEDRYIHTRARITRDDREVAQYTVQQQADMKEAIEELRQPDLHFIDMNDLGADRKNWDLIKEIANHYDLIFIDNFSKLVTRGGYDEIQEQNNISEQIAHYVEKESKTIIMLHHYGKGSNTGKRGLDARGSQKLIDDCSTFVALSRDETFTYLQILKARYGPDGYIPQYTLKYNRGRLIDGEGSEVIARAEDYAPKAAAPKKSLSF